MNEEMNKEHTGMIQIALNINKSNLEHIEFLEKKILDLQIIIDNVKSAVDYTCCGDEITQEVKDIGICPTCLEHI
jgi:hypothetical protein